MPTIPTGFQIDWQPILRISVAYLLALPSGIWHEKHGHSIGVRTFPIVAMAACGYMLILRDGTEGPGDISRVLQGLVAGIGFVGGGAILKSGLTVHGTATAAGIWTMGAMGAAAALGKYEIAALLAVLNLITMVAMMPIKRRLDLFMDDVEENGNPNSKAQGSTGVSRADEE